MCPSVFQVKEIQSFFFFSFFFFASLFRFPFCLFDDAWKLEPKRVVRQALKSAQEHILVIRFVKIEEIVWKYDFFHHSALLGGSDFEERQKKAKSVPHGSDF